MEQKVFYLDLDTAEDIVTMTSQTAREISEHIKKLNGDGWKVDHVFPLSLRGNMLTHEKELIVVSVGFLCTKL